MNYSDVTYVGVSNSANASFMILIIYGKETRYLYESTVSRQFHETEAFGWQMFGKMRQMLSFEIVTLFDSIAWTLPLDSEFVDTEITVYTLLILALYSWRRRHFWYDALLSEQFIRVFYEKQRRGNFLPFVLATKIWENLLILKENKIVSGFTQTCFGQLTVIGPSLQNSEHGASSASNDVTGDHIKHTECIEIVKNDKF
jgi:hypothetical protein